MKCASACSFDPSVMVICSKHDPPLILISYCNYTSNCQETGSCTDADAGSILKADSQSRTDDDGY